MSSANPVPIAVIEASINSIGRKNVSYEEIEKEILNLVGEEMSAKRLITWISEAFGMVLLSQLLYRAHLPTTFFAKREDGEWQELTFETEPIFGATLQLAKQMYHSEPSDLFQNIAQQSSMVKTTIDALSNELSVDVATLSLSDLGDLNYLAPPGVLIGPFLSEIPADIYPSQDTGPQKSFWRRLFQ